MIRESRRRPILCSWRAANDMRWFGAALARLRRSVRMAL